MENSRNREMIRVLFETRGDIKVTAAILGLPEGVVRRYLHRLDFCHSKEDKIRPVVQAKASGTLPDAA